MTLNYEIGVHKFQKTCSLRAILGVVQERVDLWGYNFCLIWCQENYCSNTNHVAESC